MNKTLTFPSRHPPGDCANDGLISVGDSFKPYFDVDDVDSVPDDSLVSIKRNLCVKLAWY